MDTISVDYSRKELIPIVFLGFLMFAASCWLIYAGLFTSFRIPQLGPLTSFFSIIVGSFGAVFFGYGFFYLLGRTLFPKGALVITAEGIIDNTSGISSKEVVPFSNMKKAELEIINSGPHIGITLRDEAAYLANLPFIKRKAKQLNKKYFNTSIISMSVPIESRADLVELIEIINERIDLTHKQLK